MIDTVNLTSQFFKNKQVFIAFQYHTDKTFLSLNSLLARILNRMDRPYLLDTIITVMREVILNAAKANAKRVFFARLGLAIDNPADYEKGMMKFREIISKFDRLRDDLMSSSYRITVKIRKQGEGMVIDITNNARITPFEKERIEYRIAMSARCSSFSEAYDIVYDPSEGAGLGIMLVLLLLSNAGIDASHFKIITDEEAVHTIITIPGETRSPRITSDIKEKILENLGTLPAFPENITEMQRLCNNPQATIEEIGARVTQDPSLTADVLRIANSAGFITGKRIETINEAIMIIGLKNLSAIISVAAAKKIIEKKYKRFELVWSHCVKTAFYARAIALREGEMKIAEKVFISGLLHDIGKIVLLSVDPKISRQIGDLVENRKMRTSTLMEEIAIGISHTTIGALIAEKWNFPDYLIQSIRHHHAPLAAPRSYREITGLVYLANIICNVELQKAHYLYIEEEFLKKFGIQDEKDFAHFHETLSLQYDQHWASL